MSVSDVLEPPTPARFRGTLPLPRIASPMPPVDR